MTPTPIVLSMSLCDYVIIEEVTSKASLIGCFRAQIVDTVPAQLRDFFVAAELTDGGGRGHVELVISRPDTGSPILRRASVVDFRDRFFVVRYLTRIVECVVPVPGRYTVALFVDGELVGQRTLEVKLRGSQS
jgi:Family of unknown function (DUF6941)